MRLAWSRSLDSELGMLFKTQLKNELAIARLMQDSKASRKEAILESLCKFPIQAIVVCLSG